jgi:hypothetical protein
MWLRSHSFTYVIKLLNWKQASLLWRDFCLRGSALMRHENLKHFYIYAIISGLMRFGIDDPWSLLYFVGGKQRVSPFSRQQSCRDWLRRLYKRADRVVFSLTALALGIKMSEKRKSTSLIAIQEKNQRKAISTEKRDVISRLEKLNKWLTYSTIKFPYI